MAKKLSELDNNNRMYFETLMDFMNETWQEDLLKRLKVAQKFGLDLTDEDVLQLIAPTPLPSQQDGSSSLPAVAESALPATPSANYAAATKIYGENWIVLQNRLLNAISNLDLNERRLIMFLSPLVRKAVDIAPYTRTFIVRVQDFQAEYGIKSKRYYEELANICNSLQHKTYEFWNFSKNQKYKSKVKVSWITKGDYKDNQGEVHIDLHNDVVEMLTVFDKANPFTKYERQMIVNLGSYGIILFELIASCMHQDHKQKTYTIEYLREKFNCVNTYLTSTDFKRYVLDRAIKDIEKNTPYSISYTQNKKGRVVSEITFSFKDISEKSKNIKTKEKLIRDPNTVDMFAKMTDAQRFLFANKLSELPEMGEYSQGTESYQQFAVRIAEMLQDPEKIKELSPFLKKVGFTSK